MTAEPTEEELQAIANLEEDLHEAIALQYVDGVKDALAKGVDVTRVGRCTKGTWLHEAAFSFNADQGFATEEVAADIVRLILNAGAEVNALNERKVGALYSALWNDHELSALEMLYAGANIYHKPDALEYEGKESYDNAWQRCKTMPGLFEYWSRLPRVPHGALDKAELYRPNGYGLALKDNPETWVDAGERFLQLQLMGEKLCKDEVVAEGAFEGRSILEHCIATRQFSEVVAYLHAIDEPLTAEDIIPTIGEEHDLLRALVHTGQVNQLFTEEFMDMLSTREVRELYEAIPEPARREQIHNMGNLSNVLPTRKGVLER